jgi:hypothetical protein
MQTRHDFTRRKDSIYISQPRALRAVLVRGQKFGDGFVLFRQAVPVDGLSRHWSPSRSEFQRRLPDICSEIYVENPSRSRFQLRASRCEVQLRLCRSRKGAPRVVAGSYVLRACFRFRVHAPNICAAASQILRSHHTSPSFAGDTRYVSH